MVYGPKSAHTWRTPGEPAFVSTLLEKAVNSEMLRASLFKHLEPVGLCSTEPLVSGVFIHQKPKIQMKDSEEQIELGDLLLIRHHFKSGGGLSEGRAVLLQAKSGSRPVSGALRHKEKSQFELYSDWSTQFMFPHHEIGSPPDGSEFWDFIKGLGRHASSGEYALVSNSRERFNAFPDNSPWAVGPAIRSNAQKPAKVTGDKSLAAAFEDFMFGRWGRPWLSAYPWSNHWSSFVGACLEAAIDWREYPIQRLDSAFPRRRNPAELCYRMAIAGAEYVSNWESESVLPSWIRDVRDRRNGGYQREREYRNRASCLLKGAGARFGEPDVPIDYERRMPGGISVLYVATTGPTSLPEIGPRALV